MEARRPVRRDASTISLGGIFATEVPAIVVGTTLGYPRSSGLPRVAIDLVRSIQRGAVVGSLSYLGLVSVFGFGSGSGPSNFFE